MRPSSSVLKLYPVITRMALEYHSLQILQLIHVVNLKELPLEFRITKQ